jgi:hypothetical protein
LLVNLNRLLTALLLVGLSITRVKDKADFRLQQNSPAVNAAMIVSERMTDFFASPIIGAPNIDPVEFQQ